MTAGLLGKSRGGAGSLRRWIDLFDSKLCGVSLVGATAFVAFALMDNDWHAVALTLLIMGVYWLSFRQ